MSHNAKVSCPNCEQLKASIERKDVLIRDLRNKIKDLSEERLLRSKRRIANGYL